MHIEITAEFIIVRQLAHEVDLYHRVDISVALDAFVCTERFAEYYFTEHQVLPCSIMTTMVGSTSICSTVRPSPPELGKAKAPHAMLFHNNHEDICPSSGLSLQAKRSNLAFFLALREN